MIRYIIICLSVLVFLPLCHAQEPSTVALKSAETETDLMLERTRREVRMLDDIYKGGIVTITDNFVTDKKEIPAGTAFKLLFESAEKKGWHRVRLLDATGSPYDDENVAEDEFEENAIKQLVAGETWVEKIETRDGVRHLRVATPIPVVFEKCIMCHDNYADAPAGGAIGALTYVLPIDGALVSKLAPKADQEPAADSKSAPDPELSK